MKKTLTVNLGGTVYHIDDDAYRLLSRFVLPSCLPRKCPQGSKSLLLPMWKK